MTSRFPQRQPRTPPTRRGVWIVLAFLLVGPYAPFAQATAIGSTEEGAVLDRPSPHADAMLPSGHLEPPPAGKELDWTAMIIRRTYADGSSKPIIHAVNHVGLGISPTAFTQAGIATFPLLDASRLDAAERDLVAVSYSAVQEVLAKATDPATMQLSTSSSIGITIYHDSTMPPDERSNSLGAWASAASLLEDDIGIKLHAISAEDWPFDVQNLCHMQQVALVEGTVDDGSQGHQVLIYSHDKVNVDGGFYYGVAQDAFVTTRFMWGWTEDECSPGGRISPRPMASAYVSWTPFETTVFAPYPFADNRHIADYLTAHEVGHVWGMYHSDAWCEWGDHFPFGSRPHKTIEAQSTAGGFSDPECDDSDQWGSHAHWDFSDTAETRMRQVHSNYVGCYNAGWCSLNNAPGPVTASATTGDRTVTLTWAAPNNGGNAITGYKVYRGGWTSFYPGTLVGTYGSGTFTHIDMGLVNGQTYYYYVVAQNGASGQGLGGPSLDGTGPRGPTVAATPQPTVPGAPTLDGATGGQAYVDLVWTPPGSNGGSAITSYRIYRGTCSGCESLYATGVTGTWWRDTGVLTGGTYYYKVAAVNAVGTGALSNERSASPTPPTGGPPNDHIENAFASSGTLWTPASQTTGGATPQANEQFSCGMGSATVWYRWTPFTSNTYRFSTAGSDYDTVMAVYDSGTLGAAALACNDDADGALQSRLDLVLNAGVTYWVQVGPYVSAAAGTLQLSIAAQGGGVVHVRDDDGSREGAIDVDYDDDQAIKYLIVSDADFAGATSVRLWVYAAGENCGSADGTHTLTVNGNALHTYEPCIKWSEGAYSWNWYAIPLDHILHSPLGTSNSFEVSDSGVTWGDQGTFFGIDTTTDHDRSYISQNGGGDMYGELMWYLEIVK